MDSISKERKLEYDKYVAIDGKFVHVTKENYNPYFDDVKNANGKKKKRKDVSKVGFSK